MTKVSIGKLCVNLSVIRVELYIITSLSESGLLLWALNPTLVSYSFNLELCAVTSSHVFRPGVLVFCSKHTVLLSGQY